MYTRAWILLICFLVVLLDGLDTGSVAVVAPMLSREWGLTPAMFTPAFIATGVGAVIGYMACGPCSQRFGQRVIGLSSVILFGAGTLLCALAHDVVSLSIVRFVSAIGLGGALPIAVAVSANAMPERFKATAAMLVATGLSAGGVVGGLIGGPLMIRFGWSSVFIVGGLLPLLLLPLFAWVLTVSQPAPAKQKAEVTGSRSSIGALFTEGLAVFTCLLWLFAFLIFLVSYALSSWIPTLLADFGFSPTQAPLGAAAYGAGGLVGNILVISIVGRLGIRPALMITSSCAIACIVALNQTTVSSSLVLPLIGAIGAGLITGCVGQSALAVSFYPAALRTTGVGWAAASGRIGSIVGPAAGGVMLSLGWSAREIILMAVPPIAAATLVLVVMAFAGRRSALAAGSRALNT